MKKLLSLALVLTMLFTIISVPGVSASNVQTDAEGFSPVYTCGFEESAEVTGGKTNLWSNNAVLSSDSTKKENINDAEYLVSYDEASIQKPNTKEDFGSNFVKMDTVQRGEDIAKKEKLDGAYVPAEAPTYRFGEIKNQVTFESGKTYRLSFWVYLADDLADGTPEKMTITAMLYEGGATNRAAYGDSGARSLKTGEWNKVGFIFTADDTLVSGLNTNGFSVRGKIAVSGNSAGIATVAYFDNLLLEKFGTRTREVEPGYYYEESFDYDYYNVSTDGKTGETLSPLDTKSGTYYSSYFTPTYPKPTDAETEPTWKTVNKLVVFGGGSPKGVMANDIYHTGGISMKTTATAASGGVRMADIFHGDFTTADIGRKFKISAMVYPVSSGAASSTTTPAHFAMTLGGVDGVGNNNYGNTYRGLSEEKTEKDIPWDTWSEVSTTVTIEDKYVCQTSVNDADVKGTNAYNALNALRVNQTNTKNLTTTFYTDDYVVRELVKYTITAVSSDDTLGTVTGGGPVFEDESTTLTATPVGDNIFLGWYNGDTLVSENAKLVVSNPTASATYTAKFQKVAKAEYTNEVYHYNFETGDVGNKSAWYRGYLTGETTLSSINDNNKVIDWDTAIEAGIAMPEGGVEQFGKRLYLADYSDEGRELYTELSARFNKWETAAADSKYVAGKPYKLTMWVYPASVQLRNNETAAPATVNFLIRHEDSTNVTTDVEETFKVKVGQWNKVEMEFVATDAMATTIIPGLIVKFPGTQNKTNGDPNKGKYTVVSSAYYDNIRIVEQTEWNFGDTAKPSGWVKRGGDKGMDTAFHGETVNNKSVIHVETYEDIDVPRASDNAGDHLFVFDVTRPNVKEEEYNPTEGSVFWPEGGEKMSYDDAVALYSSYSTITGDLAGRFNNIAPAGVLTIDKSYKISLKVYIDEIRDLKAEAEGFPEVVDATNEVYVMGTTTTGKEPAGDGKKVSKIVPLDTWTEISYIFRATEAGADISTSLRINFTANDLTKFPTLVYVDDVKLEEVSVDGFDLTISENEDKTKVNATATVYDMAGDTLNAVVIIGAYDAEGKLIGISSSNGGVSTSVEVGDSLEASIDMDEGISKYVAFVWDSLINIRPYVQAKVLGE